MKTTTLAVLTAFLVPVLHAREWSFTGVEKKLEAEFVGMGNGYVVLKDSAGKSFEFPFANLSPTDQQFLKTLAKVSKAAPAKPGGPVTSRSGYETKSVETLTDQVVTLEGASELHITGKGDPIKGSSFFMTSPDAWLFLDHVLPSVMLEKFLDRIRVNGDAAKPGKNLRVVQHASGSVIIPQGDDFPALTLHEGKNFGGPSVTVKCYEAYKAKPLGGLKGPPGSFVLRRGYMATLAEKEDGTGVSRNYVAQDHDLVINTLPAGLDQGVRFARVFPWRWVSKKGIAGGIGKGLDVGWFYDWNIGAKSNPDLEYVAIRQKRWWPGLEQDWKDKGINHLLGYNEPDRPDQANMSVDEAIAGWPDLLKTGLRLGSPSTSDGGLGWLYQFMEKADAAGLRVDYVAVHYYRAANDPGDAKGAAEQFRQFLTQIHERVKRPLWVTEWNNGANWTKPADPSAPQQRDAIREMTRMLDETPFVERYAPFNWVEDCRRLSQNDGSLTPAGEVYRDLKSPVSFVQPTEK
ncbi:MAG: glycosyl hydrolase [Verrucomicrobiota bacterium]